MSNATDLSGETRPAVNMPKATVWPMVVALGLVLCATGVAIGAWAFLAIGGALFVVSLWSWMAALLPGRGEEAEPLIHPLPASITGRTGTVEQLQPGMSGYRFRLPEKIHPISAGLKGGLAGALIMPVPALAWGVLSGHGLWFPVNLLAGMVLPGIDRMAVAELEQFHLNLFLIGVVIHAVMSAIVGLMYGVLLPTIPGTQRSQLVLGGLVIPLLWTGMSYGMMGVANPLLQQYVDWSWFALSQLVFGIAAAIVVVRSEKIAVPPAGPGMSIVLLAILAASSTGCGSAPGKPAPIPDTSRSFPALFATHCAGCHGADGTLGPAPPLNDPLFLRIVPDAELVRVISEGRPGTPMPAFDKSKGGPLATEQVRILAEGLKPIWGKPGTTADVPPYSTAPGGNVERGLAAYRKACAGCHGDRGQGGTFEGHPIGAINVPAYLALSSDQVLRRFIITGRPDLHMPNFAEKTGRSADFEPLDSQQVTDLTAALASWRKPTK